MCREAQPLTVAAVASVIKVSGLGLPVLAVTVQKVSFIDTHSDEHSSDGKTCKKIYLIKDEHTFVQVIKQECYEIILPQSYKH